MMIYQNPLTGADLEIKDIATASYALRLCNDNYYSVYHQGQEMLLELYRLRGEIYNQKYLLIEPYLIPNPVTGAIPKTIPDPLPEDTPLKVKMALQYLDEQYSEAERIAQADLTENVAELNEVRGAMENKIAAWFKGEIGADWLGGNLKAELSGATVIYSGGVVNFSYKELEY